MICKSGFGGHQCQAQEYDTSDNLAFSGNGFAQDAVAFDEFSNGTTTIHREEFANDGFYSNGASWIGKSSNSWLKFNLGRVVAIDSITFGRYRIFDFSANQFDDREPGQFTIEIAPADDIYAAGDDINDGTEYSLVFDSSSLSSPAFDGLIDEDETLEVSFDYPVLARFVKMTFTTNGAAIDEVEVFGKVVVEVDIKPGSCPNPLNVKSKGVLPVAIVGTDDLDVTQVDPLTVQLAGVMSLRSNLDDVSTPFGLFMDKTDVNDCTAAGADGTTDLTLKFDRRDVLAAFGNVEDGDVIAAQLTGNLLDGTPIVGEDVIVIKKKGK